jgi:hypothetical protein
VSAREEMLQSHLTMSQIHWTQSLCLGGQAGEVPLPSQRGYCVLVEELSGDMVDGSFQSQMERESLTAVARPRRLAEGKKVSGFEKS